MPNAPIVAVSAAVRETDGVRRIRLNQAYVHALETVGIVPLLVPPLADNADVPSLLERVDGLVLTGGEDIDPARYHAEPHPTVEYMSGARDATELALAEAARALRLPTLAICRGMQVINVAFGGTLVQDIPSSIAGALRHQQPGARTDRTHDITVDGDSRLADILGTQRTAVNSLHHQAVDRPGDGLRISARAPDGVIEAIECTDDGWWMQGIQWHPEELIDDGGGERGMYESFALACRDRKEGRD
ncbi:MAG TPA: gamma-glutamyl-gamma-aminobutyrate hydrolase family protein [Gemmatimonadaceae bacterium]|nr:gamma-glutamyl-gamma-aminobutyrate hydrolase family protein [Gemmatimonadaceae bacterium]